ncbi:hypothetical protein SH501x_002496 [Pirellulaceae bacterium SH501]
MTLLMIRSTTCFSIFLCLFLITLAGCSDEQRLVLPEGTLKGKILYKGKPVPYALVVVNSGQNSSTGNADDEGNYEVKNVAAGEVLIGVNTDAGRGNMMSATMAAAQTGDKSKKPTFVDLPKKFFDPTTSGIVAKIDNAKGENQFDIEIQ